MIKWRSDDWTGTYRTGTYKNGACIFPVKDGYEGYYGEVHINGRVSLTPHQYKFDLCKQDAEKLLTISPRN